MTFDILMRWKWFYNVIQQWFSVSCPIKTVLECGKTRSPPSDSLRVARWLDACQLNGLSGQTDWSVQMWKPMIMHVNHIFNIESFFEKALFSNQGVIVSIVPIRRSLPYCFGRKDKVFRIRPISTPKTDDSKRLVKFFCSWYMTKSNVLLHWY